jgi:hypothetical protein
MRALLFTFLFTITTFGSYAQSWVKLYEDSVWSNNTGMEVANGNFVSFSALYDAATNTMCSQIYKVNANGDTIWTKKVPLSSANSTTFSYGDKTDDGGFIAMGFVTRWRIYRLDSMGDTLWTKTFPPASNNGCFGRIFQTSDSCFAGVIQENLQCIFFKLDANGNTLIWKNYGYAYQLPQHMYEASNGDYVICGNFTISSYYSYLMRLNSQGDTIWTKKHPGIYLYGVTPEVAGTGYVACGYYGGQMRILKANASGVVQWVYNSPGFAGLLTWITSTSDGNYLITGTKTQSGADSLYLLKLSPAGMVVWDTAFANGPSNNIGNRCQQTSDGGYFISGISYSSQCLIKIGPADLPLSVASSQEKNKLHVYPNPVDDELSFSIFTQGRTEIELCDVTGRNVACFTKENFFEGEQRITLDVSGFAEGLYLLSVRTVTGVQVQQVVVSRHN